MGALGFKRPRAHLAVKRQEATGPVFPGWPTQCMRVTARPPWAFVAPAAWGPRVLALGFKRPRAHLAVKRQEAASP
eukprot:434498-Lingulodinium_polyedra.AAC.1